MQPAERLIYHSNHDPQDYLRAIAGSFFVGALAWTANAMLYGLAMPSPWILLDLGVQAVLCAAAFSFLDSILAAWGTQFLLSFTFLTLHLAKIRMTGTPIFPMDLIRFSDLLDVLSRTRNSRILVLALIGFPVVSSAFVWLWKFRPPNRKDWLGLAPATLWLLTVAIFPGTYSRVVDGWIGSDPAGLRDRTERNGAILSFSTEFARFLSQDPRVQPVSKP